MKAGRMFRILGVTVVISAVVIVGLVYAQSVTVDGLLEPEYNLVRHFAGSDGGTGNPNDGVAPGDLYSYTDGSTCYYAYVVDRGFNENVYSNSGSRVALYGWTQTGHTFTDLEGSDLAAFQINCGGTISTAQLDYIEDCSGSYESGRSSDSCGASLDSDLTAAATSLLYNLNNSTYPNKTTESPPEAPFETPDWNSNNDPDWEYRMIYEFSFDACANGSCCDVTVIDAHNSPSKHSYKKAALGDYVWYDDDEDGIQDPDEAGVSGVTVNLYLASDLTTPVATTTTSSTGYYIFTNLDAGTYRIEFDDTTLPGGYDFTTQDASGSTDSNDSDVGDDPIETDDTYGWTGDITLASGQYDMTWDAGISGVGETAVTFSSFAAQTSFSIAFLLGLTLLLATIGFVWGRTTRKLPTDSLPPR